ncbi:MAG: glycosyltransferase family 1 protein [Bacteroidales bacterium]
MIKNILIDIYKTKDLYSGLGEFSFNFAKEISSLASKDYNLNFLVPGNIDIQTNDHIHLKKSDFQKRYLPCLNEKYDIWHCLHQFPAHLPNKNSKLILTVHDLNFLLEKRKSKASGYLKRLQENINRASIITVISDYTKKVVLENLDIKDKPIYRIYNGVKLECYNNVPKPDYIKSNKFFFTIGIISPKKNFHTLLPLMKYFKDYQLIIAGNKDSKYAKEIERQICSLGLEGNVHLPGKISNQEKYWLYSNCTAFLLPSLAEGFGMPIIEALLIGKPVFASKHTSLQEIGGDFAFYWDNFSPDYMAEVIEKKLSYFHQNHSQLSKGNMNYAQKFNWQNCIENYLDVYNELLKNC